VEVATAKASLCCNKIISMLTLLNFYFRDGVSEGQFYQVLLYELDAIRKVGQTSYFPFVNLPTTLHS
jgi:hypothetical protein